MAEQRTHSKGTLSSEDLAYLSASEGFDAKVINRLLAGGVTEDDLQEVLDAMNKLTVVAYRPRTREVTISTDAITRLYQASADIDVFWGLVDEVDSQLGRHIAQMRGNQVLQSDIDVIVDRVLAVRRTDTR